MSRGRQNYSLGADYQQEPAGKAKGHQTYFPRKQHCPVPAVKCSQGARTWKARDGIYSLRSAWSQLRFRLLWDKCGVILLGSNRFAQQGAKMLMKIKALVCACVVAGATIIRGDAHHSFAMFDAQRTVTLKGTVKEFQWTNPHAWIILQASRSNGQQTPWAIELNGPAGLARQGWGPKTLTPGMPITMTIHPLRDGTSGGQLLTLTLPDGTQLGGGAAAPKKVGQNVQDR
jgi:hypothetical protein